MREVDTQFTSHYFVIVKIADRGCSSVLICKFSKAKAFRLASIIVVDESKVQNLADLPKYVDNLFFREA